MTDRGRSRGSTRGDRLRTGVTAFRERNERIDRALDRALETSRTSSAFAWVGPALRNSAVVEWLTSAPQPAVVEVDLDRSRTVGPLLLGLDRLRASAAGWVANSRVWSSGRELFRIVAVNPLRSASAVALGVIVAAFLVAGWPTNELVGVAAVAVSLIALLGVLIDDPERALEGSAVAGRLDRRPARSPGTDDESR